MLFEVTRAVVFSVQEQQEEYFQLLQWCARPLLRTFPVSGSPGVEDSQRTISSCLQILRTQQLQPTLRGQLEDWLILSANCKNSTKIKRTQRISSHHLQSIVYLDELKLAHSVDQDSSNRETGTAKYYILSADSENLNHIDGRQTSCAMHQVGQLETFPELSFMGSAIHNCCRLNVGQGS